MDYLLMKHFRCLPSQLDKEDNARLMQFLQIDAIVSDVKQEKMKQAERSHKSKKHGRY